MKRILVIICACLLSLSVSAQGWQVGGRIGSGFQAVGAYEFSSNNYIEARFGMNWVSGAVMADFQGLFYWHLWEHSRGWFADLGAGLGIGGRGGCYFGAIPSARFGYAFEGVPLKLSVDWSPILGIATGGGESSFFTRGLANVGVTCVYCF